MPARSTGCRVCVKRRVKCDGTRPVCLRCTKANLKCDGPPSPLPIFQDETRTVALKFAKRAALSSPKCSAGVNFDILFPPASAPDVYTDDVFCGYFLSTFFDSRNCYVDHQHQREWMADTFQHPSRYPLASLALRALSTCYFSRNNSGRDLESEAKLLYGQVLERLRAVLACPKSARSFDVLAAVSLLILFECHALTTRIGWIQHIRGMSTLMEALGPQHFQEYPARAVFTLTRPALLYASVATRERVFLERDEWHFDRPQGDSPMERAWTLRNINARVPGLQADTKQLEAAVDRASPANAASVADLLDKWLGVIAELRAWHNAWAAELPASMPVQKPVDKLTLAGANLPFDETYEYPDMMVASAFCQYHAFAIICHDWLGRLLRVSRGAGMDLGPLAFDAGAAPRAVRHHALAVAKSLPYVLSAPGANAGKLAVLFQARRASSALEPDAPVTLWLLAILTTMANRNGIKLARFMLTR